ncbi:MAG TPA: tetratricopeptide repeat protein [Phycisphaerae bacterium]|nr:tetratricopeptide repeat protein [Phycisphaerae bacterium]
MNDAAYQRGHLLFQQRRFDLAAAALRESLIASPHSAPAHALLSLCLLQQDKLQEATEEAQAAIGCAPDFAFAHYALGAIYLQRNRFVEAEAAAREAVRLLPEEADYWGLLAQTFLARKEWAQALEAADQGLRSEPEHSMCVNLRAVALTNLGRREEAAQTIAGALGRNPLDANAHANQGWTLLHQNRAKEALEHFREALRLNPQHEWARQGMMAALKARHLLYRWMLRYYLFMGRLRKGGQWALIIGFWVGAQVLDEASQKNPALRPYVLPLLVAYGVFVLATWLADPIFNLTLMVNRYGRHLLTTVQRVCAPLVGVLLVAGLGMVGVALASGEEFWLATGVLACAVALSVATVSRFRSGRQLWLMVGYTALVVAAGVAGIGMMVLNMDVGMTLWEAGLWGGVLSGLAANVLGSMVVKR